MAPWSSVFTGFRLHYVRHPIFFFFFSPSDCNLLGYDSVLCIVWLSCSKLQVGNSKDSSLTFHDSVNLIFHTCTAHYTKISLYNNAILVCLAYDRYIKLWDTETGECVSRFTSRKIPYCAKFHPDEDKQHLFVAGTSDKKIICVS